MLCIYIEGLCCGQQDPQLAAGGGGGASQVGVGLAVIMGWCDQA